MTCNYCMLSMSPILRLTVLWFSNFPHLLSWSSLLYFSYWYCANLFSTCRFFDLFNGIIIYSWNNFWSFYFS